MMPSNKEKKHSLFSTDARTTVAMDFLTAPGLQNQEHGGEERELRSPGPLRRGLYSYKNMTKRAVVYAGIMMNIARVGARGSFPGVIVKISFAEKT
jgi:hypothetical protein